MIPWRWTVSAFVLEVPSEKRGNVPTPFREWLFAHRNTGCRESYSKGENLTFLNNGLDGIPAKEIRYMAVIRRL